MDRGLREVPTDPDPQLLRRDCHAVSSPNVCDVCPDAWCRWCRWCVPRVATRALRALWWETTRCCGWRSRWREMRG